MQERTVIGLTTTVTIKGNSEHELVARVDTGATKSSIDSNLAKKLGLGPVLESRLIKSAHGSKLRPIIECAFLLHGKELKARFTLADRGHMKYKVLLGQNVLKQGFLIDPMKK